MRVRIVVGALAALVAAGVLAVLSLHGSRLAGTSHVRTNGFDVAVAGGATACQPATLLVADAAAARLLVGADGRPTPPLTLTFTAADGTPLAHGRVAGGRPEGVVTIPFARPVGHVTGSGTACVHNGGRSRIVLGGDVATAASGARVGDGAAQGVIAFTYPHSGSPSWWPLLGGIARRFPIGKVSFLGGWTLWACAALLLGAWIAALRLLLRELPR